MQSSGNDHTDSTADSRYSPSRISVSLIETTRRTERLGNTSCPREIHITRREVRSKELGQYSSPRDGVALRAHLLQWTARYSMATMVCQAAPIHNRTALPNSPVLQANVIGVFGVRQRR